MNSSSSFRVVLLTPPGRGAVATLRVEGEGACELVDSRFEPASQRSVSDLASEHLAFGQFPLGNNVYDEVVVRRPGKNVIEVHCHGGPAVVERLIAGLCEDGAERISASEWLRATSPTSITAAAHAALGNATTLPAAAILLDQFHGALDRALREILDKLEREEIDAAAGRIRRLLAVAPCGRHLERPWRVVLAGRPNVGKSNLMNALVGYGRAIVHETPGTTRDLVTARTAVDGWPVEFCDTAGLRDSEHAVEQQGIGLVQSRLESASLSLLVFDATEPWSEADQKLRRLWPSALLVFNKADLAEASVDGCPAGLLVSALDGRGIESLLKTIAERLVPNPPNPGEAVPFLDEHVTALEAATAALDRGAVAEAALHIAACYRC